MTLFLNLICISLPVRSDLPRHRRALRRNRNVIIIFERCRRPIAPHLPASPRLARNSGDGWVSLRRSAFFVWVMTCTNCKLLIVLCTVIEIYAVFRLFVFAAVPRGPRRRFRSGLGRQKSRRRNRLNQINRKARERLGSSAQSARGIDFDSAKHAAASLLQAANK